MEQDQMGALQSISRLWQGPPAYVAATAWGAPAALFAAAGIIVVGDAAAGLIFGDYLFGFSTPGSGLLDVQGERATQLASLTSQALVVALTLMASTQFGGTVRDTLALRPPASGRITYFTAVLMCFVLVESTRALLYGAFPSESPITRHTNVGDWVLDGVASVVGAPLAEELLFRGFLLSALSRSRLGYTGAAVVTSAIWAALHFRHSLAGIAVLFVMGLFLAWLLRRTGSVRVPIACHACVGAVAFLSSSPLDINA